MNAVGKNGAVTGASGAGVAGAGASGVGAPVAGAGVGAAAVGAGAAVAGAIKAKAIAAAVLFACAFALAVPATLAWSNYTQMALNEALGTDAPGPGVLVVEKKVDPGELTIPAEYSNGLFSFEITFEEAEGGAAGAPSVADATWRILDENDAEVAAQHVDVGGVAYDLGGKGTVGASNPFSFTLKDGWKCVFEKVPEGAKWHVSEVGVDEDVFKVVSRNESGSMDADGELAFFENRYILGQVDVGKSIALKSGNTPVPDVEYLREFEFEYEFFDATGNPVDPAELPGCRPSEPIYVDSYAEVAFANAQAALEAGGEVPDAPAVEEREVDAGEGAVPVQSGTVSLVDLRNALPASDKPAEGVEDAGSIDSGQEGAYAEPDKGTGRAGGSDAPVANGGSSAPSGDEDGSDASGSNAENDTYRAASDTSDGAGAEGSGSEGTGSDAGSGAEGSGGAGDAGDGDAGDAGDAGAGDAGDTGDSSFTFKLKPGQAVSFKGLPDGYSVHVTEIVPADADYTPGFYSETAEATAGKVESLTFQNVIDDVDGEPEGGFDVGKEVFRQDGEDLTDAQAAEKFKMHIELDAATLVRAGLVEGIIVPEDGSEPDPVPDGRTIKVPALMLGPGEAVPLAGDLDAAWEAWHNPDNEIDSTGQLVDKTTRVPVDVPHLPNEELEFTVAGGVATCDDVELAHGERIVVWGLPSDASFSVTEEMTPAQADVYECTRSFGDGTTGRNLPDATFENAVKEQKIDISVEKKWVLASDLALDNPFYAGFPDAEVPQSVTVTLWDGEGNEIDSGLIEEDDAGEWKHVFHDYPKFDASSGVRIAYSVTEEAVEGFKGVVSGTADAGFVVTNTQEIDVDPVAVPLPDIEKAVDGEDVPEGIRFDFEVQALDGAPLPTGVGVVASDDGKTCTVQRLGAGTVPVGSVEFNLPGTYSYKYKEVPLGFTGWLYDTTVHDVVVQVELVEGVLVASVSIDGVPVPEGEPALVRFENKYDPNAITEGELIVTMEVAEVDGFPLTDAHMEQEFLAEVELVLPVGASSRAASDDIAFWTHERYTGTADDTEAETMTLRYLVPLSHEDANRPHFFGEDGPAPDPATLAASTFEAASVRERTAVDAALDATVARGSFGTTGEQADSGPMAVYDSRCIGDKGNASFASGSDGKLHAKVSVMLKHGERLHISNLPLGTKFVATHATDEAYPKDDWSPNITRAEGSVPEPNTRHVRLINSPKEDEQTEEPPASSSASTSTPDPSDPRNLKGLGSLAQTGDMVRWILLGAAVVCAVAAVALVVSIRRGRRGK